jgi:hypothetical protein
MSTASEETQILRSLKTIGPQIERTEARRAELYAQQIELVLKGSELGLSAAAMARARKPTGENKWIGETYRQYIRKAKEEGAKKKAKRT